MGEQLQMVVLERRQLFRLRSTTPVSMVLNDADSPRACPVEEITFFFDCRLRRLQLGDFLSHIPLLIASRLSTEVPRGAANKSTTFNPN
jgi:hypothetical protein